MTPSSSSARRPRVALYARTSTVRDQNPAMQLTGLRRLAEERGWEITGEYVDHGFSGSTDRRPQLDALMKHVHRGGLQAVLVWRFDRFARSTRHLLTALEEFRVRGVDFVSLNDAIDTSTPTGRFIFSIIAAVAEFEKEIVRERVLGGLDAARQRGQQLGRPRASIDLDEARRLLATGVSLRKAATKLGVGATTLTRALRGSPPGAVRGGTAPETPAPEAHPSVPF